MASDAGGPTAVTAVVLSLGALAATRPVAGGSALAWTLTLVLACAAAGLLAGAARIRALDAGAYVAPAGGGVSVVGYVEAVPRRRDGTVQVRVATPAGRLAVEAPEPVPDLAPGAEVRASGSVARPQDWIRESLRRQGIARVLKASQILATGGRRGGVTGRVDSIRLRAEKALGRGMPTGQAALARGFVLGQDDRIEAATIEEFRRSGLAHLLAVSGQNVVLLALLAAPLLAALGIPLRARLCWLLALIALYVPLAGGGPSIQRAGIMGSAALVATLAGRPASRAYALVLAAVATLALNPRAGADVGWQLSFAAVAGIFLWAAPLRSLLAGGRAGGGWRPALADGVAVTLAATLATAPLMAHHFGELSATTLLANLLALPAVAPAMWLGMLVAGLGQLQGIPVEPLNWVNSLLLAYIGQVAAWLGGEGWDPVALPASGWEHVAGAYVLLTAAGLAFRRWERGRLELRGGGLRRPLLAGAALAAALLLAGAALALRRDGTPPPSRSGLRVSVLDVGQGDAILLQPAGALPLLVDTGPPGAQLERKLDQLGVGALAAAIVSHDQSDHAGGLRELLGEVEIHRLVYAAAGRSLIRAAQAAGAAPTRLAAGGELRSGALRVEVLWPPRELLDVSSEDPNARSLVLLARWRRFEILLTGDAEAEAVPIDPGAVDVLKIAHHGSADSGLPGLLDRAAPRIAVVSVGDDNSYGHPDPTTLAALESRGVDILRTDRDGSVTFEVDGRRTTVETSD